MKKFIENENNIYDIKLASLEILLNASVQKGALPHSARHASALGGGVLPCLGVV
jgi:hypothetical protein